MQHSGGLTSPYFSQLIYIVLAWALAFSVQRWISVVVLVAVCAMVPIWFVGVVGEPLMHIDVVIRMVALSAAGGVAYSTQRVFSNTRAAEISARHELEQLARIDPLTGLPNRAAFEERATALVARARSDSPLTLVMLDLDHFKQLNDTYGHLLGDEALAKVAMVITETVRTADVPARLGGEEFVVLLPMTDVEGATLTAERLRRAIKAIPLRDGSVLLAASLGVSSWRKGDTGASLLERADSALRRAKAQGRDRTEVEQ
jgi:diguanylate cyclase (GGDEF)-like protein